MISGSAHAQRSLRSICTEYGVCDKYRKRPLYKTLILLSTRCIIPTSLPPHPIYSIHINHHVLQDPLPPRRPRLRLRPPPRPRQRGPPVPGRQLQRHGLALRLAHPLPPHDRPRRPLLARRQDLLLLPEGGRGDGRRVPARHRDGLFRRALSGSRSPRRPAGLRRPHRRPELHRPAQRVHPARLVDRPVRVHARHAYRPLGVRGPGRKRVHGVPRARERHRGRAEEPPVAGVCGAAECDRALG